MTRTDHNIILLTDSYKLSHYKQYPPKTQEIYSYFESRVGSKFTGTLFFGLQYFIKKYLTGRVVTRDSINQAELICNNHMGPGLFNKEGWEYILEKYNGHLPVSISAVPEGTYVPVSTPLLTIYNTDPKCYWLTSYLETLLVQLWYPCNVATISYLVRKEIERAAQISGTPELVDFKLHDFGFRGSSSVESAGIGGLAHLVNFKGTDTIEAIGCGIEFYDSGVCGFSIPASEHSTITSWGKENESNAYANMLSSYPTGLVACVSDSYDIDNACSNIWGSELKEKVLSRNGTLVVRPDSGDIVPMVLNVLSRLGAAFGSYTNKKGYTVLNDKVRVIQGDGCTPESIKDVIGAVLRHGWSIDNLAFGMGGGLLQKHDRDTQRFAFKCSNITIDGSSIPVSKNPKSDPSKASKAGKFNIGREVFRNGELLVNETFDTIRNRAKENII